MDDRKIGQVYFETLNFIKDEISNNFLQFANKNNVDQETIRKLIFIANATLDGAGGNAVQAIIKSCK